MTSHLAKWTLVVFVWSEVALASDYYTSMTHLRNALAHTDDLLKFMDLYADSEIIRIQQLKQWVIISGSITMTS